MLFKDDSDYFVTVNGNMAEYKDKSVHNVGVLEIVEIDGNQYAIECRLTMLTFYHILKIMY